MDLCQGMNGVVVVKAEKLEGGRKKEREIEKERERGRERERRISHIIFEKQPRVLLAAGSSVDRKLTGRSSGENASLFRALPLDSSEDAPSPLADVRSPCQSDCLLLLSTNHSRCCPNLHYNQLSFQVVSFLFSQIQ